MIELFSLLSSALEGVPPVALGAAFIWGILSILLSPCHLASIPLIVAFINGQGRIHTRKAFGLSFLFALGILVTIGIIGVVTSMMGRLAGDIGPWGNYAVAAVFFVVGLHLLDLIPLPFVNNAASVNYKKKGYAAGLVLGLIFGIALGPCTFAYMAPILAVTFKEAFKDSLYAAALLLSYGLGHCLVIVLAGTFTEVVEHYLRWNESSKGAVVLKKICGILVILGGVYLIISTR